MKRFNTLSTKCTENLLNRNNSLRFSAGFAPIYPFLQQRWNSSKTTNVLTQNHINPTNSQNITNSTETNELSNKIDPNTSLTTPTNTTSITSATSTAARISPNIPNHSKFQSIPKLIHNNRTNLGNNSYYHQNKRLFNIQSQSASNTATDDPDDNYLNDDDNDSGYSLRDLDYLRSNLGKTIGSKIYIWGSSQGTSMGFDETDNFDTPIPVHLDSITDNGGGYRDISLGLTQTGIVTSRGDLYVFGGSKYGELGIGEDVNVNTVAQGVNVASGGAQFIQYEPTKVEGIDNVVKVSCGTRHTAAINAKGELYTWGWGGSKWTFACGGLGHGNKDTINYPKKVEFADSDTFIIDVSCGEKHTLALSSDGSVYAMGEGEHGRLGTGHTSNCKLAYKLEYFNEIEISHIYAAKEYSFALSCKDGIPFGWGRNDRNQMGQGGGLAMDIYSCDPTPGPINLGNVINIDLSQSDVIACTMDGTVYYWGDRVYLEPNNINSERFQDEIPNGIINNVGVSSTGMFFLSNLGELFSCNKTLGMRSDVFTLGHGAVLPFKIAKRVEALDGLNVKKICASDQRTAVIVE